MSDDYTPIACDRYSELELHIMHRERLRAAWRDEAGGLHQEVLRPTDLQTRSGEEFLLAQSQSGEPLEIRLDRLLRADPL